MPKPKRKSDHTATQLDIPEASIRTKRRYKKLIDLCTHLVITNGPLSEQPKMNRIKILFKKDKAGCAITPKGWPKGLKVKIIGDSILMSYSAHLVIIWLYEQRIIDYTPSMLYNARSKFSSQLTHMENSLDIDNLKEYNYD